MTVLGIDGALGGFSAAVVRDGTLVASTSLDGHVALERGLSAIAELLSGAGIAPADVDRVAVGIGPGGFTGTRIAVSYAKSLAFGWRKPLSGISSFDALEEGAAVDASRALLTVVRGRTGVISVRFRANGREVRASGYVADALDALGLANGSVQVLGDAEDVLGALGERGLSVQKIARALSPAALAVATAAVRREPARSVHELRPDYGELPAARVPKNL